MLLEDRQGLARKGFDISITPLFGSGGSECSGAPTVATASPSPALSGLYLLAESLQTFAWAVWHSGDRGRHKKTEHLPLILGSTDSIGGRVHSWCLRALVVTR